MNKTKKQNKRLASLAAICSSVFLLAACEPGTEQTGEMEDESAPTYGEPDREAQPPDPGQEPSSPGMEEQSQQPGSQPTEEPGGTSQPSDSGAPN